MDGFSSQRVIISRQGQCSCWRMNIELIIDGLPEAAVGNGDENSDLSERQF
jgi:hypothetical protein